MLGGRKDVSMKGGRRRRCGIEDEAESTLGDLHMQLGDSICIVCRT
jgi:hypothetical protein